MQQKNPSSQHTKGQLTRLLIPCFSPRSLLGRSHCCAARAEVQQPTVAFISQLHHSSPFSASQLRKEVSSRCFTPSLPSRL